MLEYGILTRAPITLITGEVGAGKTTLLLQLLRSMDEDVCASAWSRTPMATAANCCAGC